jgi:hypothetical protein
MRDVIREGGWPMFPILALGVAALLAGLRHAVYPQRSLRPLVIGLAVSTVVMGLFGTALGIQQSARYIGDVPPEQRFIFLIGLAESLNCLAIALAFTLPAAFLGTLGAFRMARRLELITARSAQD